MRRTICICLASLLSLASIGATPATRPAVEPVARPPATPATRPAAKPVARPAAVRPAAQPPAQPLSPEQEIAQLIAEFEGIQKASQVVFDKALKRTRRLAPAPDKRSLTGRPGDLPDSPKFTAGETALRDRLTRRARAIRERIAAIRAANQRKEEEMVGMTLEEATKAFATDGKAYIRSANAASKVYKLGGRGSSYYLVTVEGGKVVSFEKRFEETPPEAAPARSCAAGCGCRALGARTCSCGIYCGTPRP